MKDYLNNKPNFDKITWMGILSLIVVIAGIFGFLYEFIFYFFNSGMKEFYWRGGNFLPWINIYATGSLLIIFLTFRHRKNKLRVFLTSFIASGILEYIGGLLMDIFNSVRCWDYNQEILNFGNINGYVCFRSVLFFGLSGLLLMYIILPFIFYLAHKINKKTFLIVSFSLFIIFMSDELYNLVVTRLFNLPRASSIYKKLGFKYLYFYR